MKKTTLCMVVCMSIGLFSVMSADAANYSTDLVFQTADQSMWGSGSALTVDYTKFFGPQWNESWSVGDIKKDPWFDSEWGAEVWAKTHGKVGFEIDAHLDSGSVNVEYPVGIALEYPDIVRPGETFTISSSYVVNSTANMTTNFPEANLSAAFVFDMYAEAGGKACFGSYCSGVSSTLIDISEKYTLVDIATGDAAISLDEGIYKVDIEFPEIETVGELDNGTLTSKGEDDFLEITADLDMMITAQTGIPMNGSVDGFSYTLLDANAMLIFAATQDFAFNPGLTVDFELETGELYSMPIGSSIDIVLPEGVGDLDITPTFWLDNVLSNDTGIRVDPAMELNALSVSGSLFDVDFDTGFLVSRDGRENGVDLNLFADDFQLQGFDRYTTGSFSVTADLSPAPY